MNVLIGCEESQIVAAAFAERGHEVLSCDIARQGDMGLPHYRGDLFDLDFSRFDLVVVHPPCQTVCNLASGVYQDTLARAAGLDFIWRCWSIPVAKLCLENPAGCINRYLPEMPLPQYVEPFFYGDAYRKRTGLWLRGLPKLRRTRYIEPVYSLVAAVAESPDRGRWRSRFSIGMARAMAAQWG